MNREPHDKGFADEYLEEVMRRINPGEVRGLTDEIVRDISGLHNPVLIDTLLEEGRETGISVVVGKDNTTHIRSTGVVEACIDNHCVEGYRAEFYFGESGGIGSP